MNDEMIMIDTKKVCVFVFHFSVKRVEFVAAPIRNEVYHSLMEVNK